MLQSTDVMILQSTAELIMKRSNCITSMFSFLIKGRFISQQLSFLLTTNVIYVFFCFFGTLVYFALTCRSLLKQCVYTFSAQGFMLLSPFNVLSFTLSVKTLSFFTVFSSNCAVVMWNKLHSYSKIVFHWWFFWCVICLLHP